MEDEIGISRDIETMNIGYILKKWTSMIKQKTRKGGIKMSGKKNTKYTNEFKQTIVKLYHSGKTYAQIQKE